jgi:hypothetical protein
VRPGLFEKLRDRRQRHGKELFINFRKLGLRKRDSVTSDMASSSSLGSVSSNSDEPRRKKFDFSRQQHGALASKKLKELVGKSGSENGLNKPSFGDMYEDLLDGSSLSLLNEDDWRKLIEKKEMITSRLTDIYRKKVHHVFEERTRRLNELINQLIVCAYGRRLSSEEIQISNAYDKYVKNHGKFQFLDKNGKHNRKVSETRGPKLQGSAKMTSNYNQVSQVQTHVNCASAEGDSGLVFRRFGKNRGRYRKIVNLVLKYFKQVKESAYKLDGNFYFFIQMDDHNRGEGWFQFKSMVYHDLMEILFKDGKVSAVLTHLRSFFNRNAFYASRYKSLKEKLDLIENHLSAFMGKLGHKLDPERDGQNIFQAVNKFKKDKVLKREKRVRRAEVNRKNGLYTTCNETRKQRLLLTSKMLGNGSFSPSDRTEFIYLQNMLVDCYHREHRLMFQKEFPEPPKMEEVRALAQLNYEELKGLLTVSRDVAPWFLYYAHCIDCQQKISFVHFTEKLSLSLSSVNNIPRHYFNHTRRKKKKTHSKRTNESQELLHLETNNRISNPYSFNKSEIMQDHVHLASPEPRQLTSTSKQLELSTAINEHPHTLRKKKKRKRRKKTKRSASDANKIEAKHLHHRASTNAGGTGTRLFSQLATADNGNCEASYENEFQDPLGSPMPEELGGNSNAPSVKCKEEEELNVKMEMIMGGIRNLEEWNEAVAKLSDKRRREERSRKKGQRRNRKFRMNEDLKAVKTYLEWKEGLEQTVLGQRSNAEGVWSRIQKSLVIHKRL